MRFQKLLFALLEFLALLRRSRFLLQGKLHLNELAARIAFFNQAVCVNAMQVQIVAVFNQRRFQARGITMVLSPIIGILAAR